MKTSKNTKKATVKRSNERKAKTNKLDTLLKFMAAEPIYMAGDRIY